MVSYPLTKENYVGTECCRSGLAKKWPETLGSSSWSEKNTYSQRRGLWCRLWSWNFCMDSIHLPHVCSPLAPLKGLMHFFFMLGGIKKSVMGVLSSLSHHLRFELHPNYLTKLQRVSAFQISALTGLALNVKSVPCMGKPTRHPLYMISPVPLWMCQLSCTLVLIKRTVTTWVICPGPW